jgi:NCAIR mutase (PurE)-related protein
MEEKIRHILEDVRRGAVSTDEALKKLKTSPFEDLGYAKIDHHRYLRQGVGEVIFAQNKTDAQLCGIVSCLTENGAENILVTRLEADAAETLAKSCRMEYNETAKIGIVNKKIWDRPHGHILVASGGTSDMRVSEEAAVTAEALGNKVTRLYDVGVAGIHRLLSNYELLLDARVIIAVAGMEGALASVIGGLVDCPVIAVPTSVGYGASFGGLSALLTMLNACASGVTVVNIDNGFGAGYTANMINRMESCK